jgi:hypothetical protein
LSWPARLRRTSRFHLSAPSRVLSGELPHSPADYGLPFRSLDPAIAGHVARPSRSPWARSTRATAQIRFTSLRSFAFCESVHARGGYPTPHGRSSLGCFCLSEAFSTYALDLEPFERPASPELSVRLVPPLIPRTRTCAPLRAASRRPGAWPLSPSPADLLAALDARLTTQGPLSPLAG